MKDDEVTVNTKEININDDKVKDRWSWYIGAMGIEAVAKQANARIFIQGLGGLGVEISKNIVLAGCKEVTINDFKQCSKRDQCDNFFITKQDAEKKFNRAQACQMKL